MGVYPFTLPCLFPKHGVTLLHNHSKVIKSGNSTNVLLFLKKMGQFSFLFLLSFFFMFNRCHSLCVFLMFPHERILVKRR